MKEIYKSTSFSKWIASTYLYILEKTKNTAR